jgi:NDP-sugar pyrophosphorylase family protein
MAGMGSRFKDAGYKKQKPMIDVLGRPMIQVVTDSIGIKANYIFIARKQKDQEYSNEDIEHVLGSLNLDHKIIMIDQITDGASII